jgi:hypothetical protein
LVGCRREFGSVATFCRLHWLCRLNVYLEQDERWDRVLHGDMGLRQGARLPW